MKEIYEGIEKVLTASAELFQFRYTKAYSMARKDY
jgi:hypothetical protein